MCSEDVCHKQIQLSRLLQRFPTINPPSTLPVLTSTFTTPITFLPSGFTNYLVSNLFHLNKQKAYFTFRFISNKVKAITTATYQASSPWLSRMDVCALHSLVSWALKGLMPARAFRHDKCHHSLTVV